MLIHCECDPSANSPITNELLQKPKNRYKGITPSRLLTKMESTRAQAILGKLPANEAAARAVGRQARSKAGGSAPRGAEVLVLAQETDYRGLTLEKSTMQYTVPIA